jgi:hypothetical protein
MNSQGLAGDSLEVGWRFPRGWLVIPQTLIGDSPEVGCIVLYLLIGFSLNTELLGGVSIYQENVINAKSLSPWFCTKPWSLW